jgi:hypothetical protein
MIYYTSYASYIIHYTQAASASCEKGREGGRERGIEKEKVIEGTRFRGREIERG